MIKWSREDSWVAYVLFLRNRKQFLRSVNVYVVFWTFLIFGKGKKCFRWNNLAGPLQYLRGPPVEDLCTRVLWQMQFSLQPSIGVAASEPESEQTDKEGWLCAGCWGLGTAQSSWGGKDVVQHKHKLLNIMENTTHTLHRSTYWSDNRVSSVRGSISSVAIRAFRGGRSCPPR